MSEQSENRSPPSQPSQQRRGSGRVWTFRGYELRPSDFTTAMVHLFRAEISRANIWRQRLDSTTNWAVVTTGAVVTFVFNVETPGSHSVVILNTLLVTLFLFIEARRYRYYELWSARVRLMETDFFAAMLVPPFGPAPDWAESLAESLLQPSYPISLWEALGRRLRRNYLWIYLILAAVWGLKIGLHPRSAASFAEFVDRAAIGGVPGWLVLLGEALFYGGLVVFAFLTRGLRQAPGEVLPRFDLEMGVGTGLAAAVNSVREYVPWFRPSRRRQQILTLIVTDRPTEVGQHIIEEMQRGVTRLEGVGMYSGRTHAVLMCALTVTEVAHLKAVVSQADPTSFVIIAPAQEVLGQGFAPLEEKGQGKG